MTTRTKPPFRADHVGSFLRPARLKDARAQREKGEISADALRKIEDEVNERIAARAETPADPGPEAWTWGKKTESTLLS